MRPIGRQGLAVAAADTLFWFVGRIDDGIETARLAHLRCEVPARLERDFPGQPEGGFP